MSAAKYLKILREIKDVAFATVDEDGRPQVRIIDIMIAEGEKLYFVTARGKDFHNQISLNANVAITAMTKDYLMIRLDGKVRKVSQKLLERVFRENPSMSGVYPGESRNILDVFCVEEGSGESFNLSSHPIERESFSFGDIQVSPKGFIIDESCIGCGKCKEICPQQCIDADVLYRIRQENCLHCGLCSEYCPVGAVNKR